ncbi:MAG: metal ABC transporter ATP-binding protein [Ilumatobacter sp.]|nr:metal ABC transporter ATP-binding protein [Ilumatobacter sp.]
MGITLTSPPGPAEPHADDSATRDAPAITVRSATVHRGGRPVLTVDRLDIPRGVTAVVGPNGSGKSTLLHAIAGVLPVAAGEISVDGRVAYVLQSQHASEHLLVTAREVVSLARASERGPFRRLRPADRAAVQRAMERLDVADLGRRHLAEMSGGQRQRVFVAQGLAQDADVLLLDEPVAGLDVVSLRTIRSIIADERAAGRAVVVAMHDLDEAARADHVVLVNGRVVAAGPPDTTLTPDHLRVAYGGRVLSLGDDLVAIDDGVHHPDHEHHHHDHPA